MFKKVKEAYGAVKLVLKYKDLGEFLVLLYKTIVSKVKSKSGELSDDEKASLKKEFGEAIDNSF